MSNGDQAAAIRLLMAARELLTDTRASDDERQRLAHQIGRFINHEPVDFTPPTVTPIGNVRDALFDCCGSDVGLPSDGQGRIAGESDEQLAERRRSARRGRLEHDE